MGKISDKGPRWIHQLSLFLLLSLVLIWVIFWERHMSPWPGRWGDSIEYMKGMFDWPVGMNAFIIIALIVLFCVLVGRKRDSGKNLLKAFAVPMLIIWILGFISYTWIHAASYQQFTFAENILKSIVDAFKLFLFEYNGDAFANMDANRGDLFSYDVIAKAIVMVLCILASICTSVLIISLFANRLSAFIRLKFHRVNSRKKHLYIFWGVSESAILLARSIKEAYEEKAEDPFILFVDNISNENIGEGDVMDSIKDFCAPSGSLMIGNDDLGDYCVAEHRLASIDKSQVAGNDVLSFVDLRVIKRRIRALVRIPDSQLHIFFLGDNENENIRSASLLKNDCTITAASKSGLKTKIYCHARHDSVNRAIEDTVLGSKIDIKVVDSSYLSVGQLKRTPEWHPVNFVDISTENPGTVTTPFTSLVVGFGQTGRDAVRFLYEFGAFVDSSSTDDKVMRSPFECHVVDEKMKDIEGVFSASVPNIGIQSSSPSLGDKFASNNIFLYDCNYGGEMFYQKVLSKIASRLNYVVLATGNDETNITVAVNILEYVHAHGNDLSRFRIFIRCYKKGNFDHLEGVVNHYNNIMNRTAENPVISIFGMPEDIYDYEFIVKDKHVEDARRFYKKYNDTISESSVLLSQGDWDEREQIVLGNKSWQLARELNLDNGDGKPIPEGKIADCFAVHPMGKDEKASRVKTVLADRIQKLRRQISQDMSNAYHRYTKCRITDVVLESMIPDVDFDVLADMECVVDELWKTKEDGGEKWVLNDAIKEHITYKSALKVDEDMINRLFLNLARLEHLRWNAAHEILGYVPAPSGQSKCIEQNKTHNCLIPWEKLDEASVAAIGSWPDNVFLSDDPEGKKYIEVHVEYLPDYKKYDFNVVMTSLKLHVEDERNKKCLTSK